MSHLAGLQGARAPRELVPSVEALGAAVEAVSRQPWGEPWLQGGAAGGLWSLMGEKSVFKPLRTVCLNVSGGVFTFACDFKRASQVARW